MSLDVTWTVTDREGRPVLLVQRTALKEPLTTADYESLVSAKSRCLADLSRAIAREIMLLQSKTASGKQ